eukprot:CAMPEP_0185035476 /NCGR_PEP_ID=MMETSP1103-20130426/26918_1 /TAXON_ID=36769 /ORGANISM="Paraphysomonas bandaiensis, Strain Caron Lab Isolate" /LENGTH=218 /DNA_ID=CAMNT_0027572571 /DNA_START=187 /DNA_END=843 /DNA_ORIENTATION=+
MSNEVHQRVNFVLYRVPFFLEPGYIDKPADFWETHDTRMIRKFGSKEEFERVKAAHGLIPRGAEVGLDRSVGFTQENLTLRRQSSTLNAHRLIYFVTQEYSVSMAEELYNLLNKKHFTESGILNDTDLLLDSAEAVGADRRVCATFLESSRGKDAVLRTVDMVHELGIHSIPTLVVDGRYVVSGAARADEVANTLRQVIRDGNSISGKRMFDEIMRFD